MDNLSDLPKDKQPPEDIVWDGSPEDLDDWISKVFDKKQNQNAEILLSDIEG